MKSELLKGKMYKISPLREALFIGFCVFFAIIFTTYFIYFHALNAQKGEIREGLMRTAQVVATYIDGSAHKTFIDRNQEQGDAYKKAIEPFEKALAADDSIKYLYTGILKDGKVYFVLDPTPEGDADGDGVDDKAHIMDEYSEATDDMVLALKEQRAVVSQSPYRDRWGSFVSGYIPFYDDDKKFVGVLGIDIEASNYFMRLAPIERATTRTMVVGFFISFLIASLVWFTRRFGLIINTKRLALIEMLKSSSTPKQDQ
jgi:hypothetical protein